MWQMLLGRPEECPNALSHNILSCVHHALTKTSVNSFKYISLNSTLIVKTSNAMFANTQMFLFPFLSDLQSTQI